MLLRDVSLLLSSHGLLTLTRALAIAETNYNLQGDAAFYSEEMINKRHKCRNNAEVMAAIKEWWE